MAQILNNSLIAIQSSSHWDTRLAVRAAAGPLEALRPQLLLVFIGGRHDGAAALTELKALFPGVSIVGGSVAGTVSREKASYGGFEMSLVAFLDPVVTPRVFVSTEAANDDFGRAFELGGRVGQLAADGCAAILLYDSVMQACPRKLHFGSEIARGFVDGLDGRQLKTVGAGLLTGFNFDDSWLLDGHAIRKHTIVTLVFPPNVGMETFVLRGSAPTGIRVRITKLRGADIMELDGRPAYTVLCELLKRNPNQATNVLALNVSLGQRHLERSGDWDEEDVLNRLILSEDEHRNLVTLFEPDFQEGTLVELLLQDPDFMESEVKRTIDTIATKNKAPEPAFCLYFDCAGRSNALAGSRREEGETLMAGLPEQWPGIGIYSGVEIAPVRGKCRALDLTGVLARFSVG
jgi:hypothetical protein